MTFFSDKNIMRKKRIFADIRAKLQTKGYGVGQAWAKTYLRAREALDIWGNNQISKTLVQSYDKNTLFILKSLPGVSFVEENLSHSVGRDHWHHDYEILENKIQRTYFDFDEIIFNIYDLYDIDERNYILQGIKDKVNNGY